MQQKHDLLNVFKTYSSAAEFFGITRGAVTQWNEIPKLRLFEMEKAGLISFNKKSRSFDFLNGSKSKGMV